MQNALLFIEIPVPLLGMYSTERLANVEENNGVGRIPASWPWNHPCRPEMDRPMRADISAPCPREGRPSRASFPQQRARFLFLTEEAP